MALPCLALFAHYAFSRFLLRRTAHRAGTGYGALTRWSLIYWRLRRDHNAPSAAYSGISPKGGDKAWV